MNYGQMTFLFISSPIDPTQYICKVLWVETSEESSEPALKELEFNRAMQILWVANATGKLVF